MKRDRPGERSFRRWDGLNRAMGKMKNHRPMRSASMNFFPAKMRFEMAAPEPSEDGEEDISFIQNAEHAATVRQKRKKSSLLNSFRCQNIIPNE
jgi:hypothetical protein